MNITILLFYIFIFTAVHTYVLYPIIIRLISNLKRSPKRDYPPEVYEPEVSILISAYNEEKVIERRIKNIAAQNYDLHKIEVLIGSDCSEDGTNDLLQKLGMEYKWLKIFLFEERRGKAGVINDLVNHSKYDILVFTDANTEYDKNCLSNLVQDFKDPMVGGVSGRLILTENPAFQLESVEEIKYWEYETYIKKSEGSLGILIGANGGNFATRKKHFIEIPSKKAVTDDFYIALCVLLKDKKFTYRFDAKAVEEVSSKVSTEYFRKVRFSATNFQTLTYFTKLLFNKNFLLSYAFWSHKVMRWFFPFVLIAILLTNLVLIGEGAGYLLIIALQILFYSSALLGYLLSGLKIRIQIFSLPYFFTVANAALTAGFFRFLLGKHSVIWQTAERE
jgi:cellulose synthase/poly-beta-1,6-N-acetylglucosamine synthase-like glycosyltransferase